MSNTSALTKDLVHQLGVFLKTQVPSLVQVLEEWPDANVQLQMPSITIFTGNPVFTPFRPTVYSNVAKTGDDTHRIIEMMVGEWDYNIQLDLWASNREQRGVIFDLVFNALTALPPYGPNGVSLQLPNYYNVWCRYDLDNITFLDDEAAVQRAERRVKIMLLSNVPAIRTQTVPIMKTIELEFDTPDTIPND